MNKKEDIKKKETIQLSIEFPSCNKMHGLNSNFKIENYIKCNTPVISLLENDFLSKKTKSNYINLVLNNTKSF